MSEVVCCFCGEPIRDQLRVQIALPLEGSAVQGLWSHCRCLTTRLPQGVSTLANNREAPSLTPDEAYEAMFAFIEMQYETTQASELGALLGTMALLPDGDSADPAVQADWLKALEQARQNRVASALVLAGKRGGNEA